MNSFICGVEFMEMGKKTIFAYKTLQSVTFRTLREISLGRLLQMNFKHYPFSVDQHKLFMYKDSVNMVNDRFYEMRERMSWIPQINLESRRILRDFS